MALEVTYKGTQIAQLTTNGNLTLETAGKYCEGNIGIAYTGGGGFDANSAILKVITSTNCTVLVTGTNYSETHQQADGFPRSSDANVTEHFFSIPTTAFGTITVTSTNTYGNNTKTITVDTAGKVYEVLCGGKNIILDGTFGLQDGYVVNNNFPSNYGNLSYDDRKKQITGNYNSGNYNNTAPLFNQDIPVSAYSQLKITGGPLHTGYDSWFYLVDEENYNICTVRIRGTGSDTATGDIDETLLHSTAKLTIGEKIGYISEIILT